MKSATPILRPNRATRYEVVATKPGHPDVVVGYTARNSRPGLVALLRGRGPEIIDHCAIGDTDLISLRTQPRVHATVAGWVIGFTGRTEREAFYAARPSAHPDYRTVPADGRRATLRLDARTGATVLVPDGPEVAR